MKTKQTNEPGVPFEDALLVRSLCYYRELVNAHKEAGADERLVREFEAVVQAIETLAGPAERMGGP